MNPRRPRQHRAMGSALPNNVIHRFLSQTTATSGLKRTTCSGRCQVVVSVPNQAISLWETSPINHFVGPRRKHSPLRPCCVSEP